MGVKQKENIICDKRSKKYENQEKYIKRYMSITHFTIYDRTHFGFFNCT